MKSSSLSEKTSSLTFLNKNPNLLSTNWGHTRYFYSLKSFHIVKLNYNIIPSNPNCSHVFPPFITPFLYNYLVSVQLTAYDRPINQYYDILATHKRSFAKQNDISTVKKLYPSDSPIYLNFMNDKGSISLNKGKQKTDLHFEIYKRFREVADKATSEIKRTSEVIRNYMSLSVNQFTARYNIELTYADKKDIESKDRLLKIDDFKNNYVEKEKPQLTPTITNTGQLKPKI